MWSVRKMFGDFVSHLNSMPWGHSPHNISGCRAWGWWHDVRWLMGEIETQNSRYTMIHHTLMLLMLFIIFLWFVVFFLSWLTTPKHESIGWIFGERPSQLHRDMFAALHGQGPEELTNCRASCGPSALHPEEKPCVKENHEIFWSTSNFIFLIYDAAWVTVVTCLFITYYATVALYTVAWYDSTWFTCIS